MSYYENLKYLDTGFTLEIPNVAKCSRSKAVSPSTITKVQGYMFSHKAIVVDIRHAQPIGLFGTQSFMLSATHHFPTICCNYQTQL